MAAGGRTVGGGGELADRSEAGGGSPALAGSVSDVLVGSSSAGRLWSRLAGLVPGSFAGARIDPGRRGAVSMVALALVAAAAVGVLTWRSRPAQVPVTAPVAVRSGGLAESGPAGSSASPSVGATGPSLIVAVAGKVRRPGVVTLPAGSRVIDAVRAAGGALPGVDLGLLNLARRLSDGELVVVGLPAGPDPAAAPADPAAGPAGAPGAPLDLNAATAEQLDALPGVGPVLAQRIVEFRTVHGRFNSVDQLRDVNGIGDSKFAQLRDRVTV
jgi:competence protein ComEA